MPTYEYRCPNGHDFEKFFRSISSAESETEIVCPVCGAIALRQLSSSAGLMFKGSGFYLTDYGKNAHGKKAPPATAGGESAASGSGEGSSGAGESRSAGGEKSGTGGDTGAGSKPASDGGTSSADSKKAGKPPAAAPAPKKPSSGKQGE